MSRNGTITELQRILVVDDDPMTQKLICLTLENVGGFTVQAYGDGRQAVDHAVGFAPDLILLDVMMPGLNGPETLDALRGLPGMERTPVVFLTATAETSELARYRELGVQDIISKPFNPATLPVQVRNIWDYYHA